MNDFMIKSPDRWVFGPDRPVTSILDQVRYQEQEDDGNRTNGHPSHTYACGCRFQNGQFVCRCRDHKRRK